MQISWLNGSLFGGDDRGFLKEGAQDPSNETNVAKFVSFFTSLVYGYEHTVYQVEELLAFVRCC
jgi:hypothetical protein